MKTIRAFLFCLTALLGIISLVCIFGYIFDLDWFRTWGKPAPISLPASIAFGIVSLILFLIGLILSEVPCQKNGCQFVEKPKKKERRGV